MAVGQSLLEVQLTFPFFRNSAQKSIKKDKCIYQVLRVFLFVNHSA